MPSASGTPPTCLSTFQASLAVGSHFPAAWLLLPVFLAQLWGLLRE